MSNAASLGLTPSTSLFGRLMAQDKASNPVGEAQSMDDPLTNARFGGGSYPWYGRY